MNVQVVTTELACVEYTDVGKGEVVLFFHGGHGNCKEHLFQDLFSSSEYRLITPTRPGYGQTTLTGFESPVEAARLIKSLIIHLEIKKVIVVGISAGGLTAIAFASAYQEFTVTLILISAVTKKWLSKSDSLYKKGKLIFSPWMQKFSWMMFRSFYKILPSKMSKVLMSELTLAQDFMLTKSISEELKGMTFLQSSDKGFSNDLDQDLDLEIIQKIKCPTLILHSQNDATVNLSFAHYANEKIEFSELNVYDNKSGHLLILGKDKVKVTHDVMNFIKKHSL